MAELLGAHDAAQWTNSPVPDDIYLMMSRILAEVRQMVGSLFEGSDTIPTECGHLLTIIIETLCTGSNLFVRTYLKGL